MSTHTIRWSRSGTYDGTDWEDEQTITFRRKHKGFEIVALHPGAGYHGAFSSIAARMLLEEAEDWLSGEGSAEARKIAPAPSRRKVHARDYTHTRTFCGRLLAGRAQRQPTSISQTTCVVCRRKWTYQIERVINRAMSDVVDAQRKVDRLRRDLKELKKKAA
jgi:hypothetical protein